MKIKNVVYTILLTVLKALLIATCIAETEGILLTVLLGIDVIILCKFWTGKNKTKKSKIKKIVTCTGIICLFIMQYMILWLYEIKLPKFDEGPAIVYSFQIKFWSLIMLFTFIDMIVMIILNIFALIDSKKQQNDIAMITSFQRLFFYF